MVKVIKSNSKPIEVGSVLDASFDSICRSFNTQKKVILMDEYTQELCWPYLQFHFEDLKMAELLVIPAGEESKSLEIAYQLWSALSEYQINRNDLIINLGGGVITDLGGFISSTFKRGMQFINIPTTLLGMVDAAIGGKSGINLDGFKNQIGVFSSATATFCDPIFLKTLPEKEILSGKAEMLKHGLIANSNLWETIAASMTKIPSSEQLFEAIKIKNEIVSRDFKEEGERKKLNFGHTIGHAIESQLIEQGESVTHGECVAWGMVAESFLSTHLTGLELKKFQKIKDCIALYYKQLPIKSEVIPDLINRMRNDKKNTNEKINFTLLTDIGASIINQSVEEEFIEIALKKLIN